MLVACQSDKDPEQTTADSTTIAASTTVTTTDTNLAPVETTSVSQADTGNAVTTTVVTQETNAPAATKTTTTTTATSVPPVSVKTTVKTVQEQPARTETQPVPEKKPVEAAPVRETETAKPTPPVTPPAVTASDPKAIFLQEKCTSCHSITSAGIADKVQRDLSGIGAKRSESWITQFLQNQVDLDGKPHKKTFKGTDAELKMVARWLAAMK
jgi:cytochrome c551/c552